MAEFCNEELVTVYADEALDEHIGALQEQWAEAEAGSPEAARIHSAIMDALKLKKEIFESSYRIQKDIDERKANADKEVSEWSSKVVERQDEKKRDRRKFIVQTVVQMLGIAVPAGLSIALLRYSEGGSYMTGEESKVFGWLFNAAKSRT